MESLVNNIEDIKEEIRQTLSSYKPGSTQNLQGHGFKRVCLQLFGLVGDGKSSLVNSCLCVVNSWPFSNEAGAGTSSEPFTKARQEYKLTDTVYMIDNRGLNEMRMDERLELSAQLRTLRPLSNVDWEFEMERTVNQLEDRWNNHSMDFMVPVFVFSSDHTLDKDLSNGLSPFLRDAFDITGIFPIVVLTKHKTKDPAETLKAIRDLGCHHVFIIDNYTTADPSRSAATDSAVLNFLNTCLQEADRGIQKKQSSNSQWEFLKQAANQIKAEMKRQKELQAEELGRRDTTMREKENEWERKENEKKNQTEIVQVVTNETQNVSYAFGQPAMGLFGHR